MLIPYTKPEWLRALNEQLVPEVDFVLVRRQDLTTLQAELELSHQVAETLGRELDSARAMLESSRRHRRALLVTVKGLRNTVTHQRFLARLSSDAIREERRAAREAASRRGA
ncbi:MAG: hypothetical protein HY962_06995 [Ignavibacteriae bacterium]|nr:hypothetical protein [Ignavibacteriota bacterium]